MDQDLFLRYFNAPPGPLKSRLENQLVKENYFLVNKLVDKLLFYSEVHIDKEDAYQFGLIGLMTALRRFDPSRGTKLSTYAAWWIRLEIGKALLHETPIYRPRAAGIPWQTKKLQDDIEGRTGVPATAEQLGLTEAQLEKYLSVAFHYMPLDADDNETLRRRVRAIPDDGSLPEEAIHEKQLHDALTDMVSLMSDDEKRVIFENDKKVEDYEAVRARVIAWGKEALRGFSK
jgi:RNA polymerase sigma factor (sigma-70 family)